MMFDLNKIFVEIDTQFSLEELRNLCFFLDIDDENLPNQKDAFVREFVKSIRRRQLIRELVAHLKQQRPKANWENIFFGNETNQRGMNLQKSSEFHITYGDESQTFHRFAKPSLVHSSIGLGSTKHEWENKFIQTGKNALGAEYANKYTVLFLSNKAWYIEQQWTNQNAINADRAILDSLDLTPNDSNFIYRFFPDGSPEINVHIYFSESLKTQFKHSDWNFGGPGTFVIQYNKYNQKVTRVIIAIDINP
jgi:hypothetical protein